MTTGQTFYSNQGAPIQALSDSDYLVLNQVDSTTGTGYRTGTTNLGLVKSLIFNSFTTDETLRLVNFDTTLLLSGTGTTNNPIKMSPQGLSTNWMANTNSTGVSQLGDMIYPTLGLYIDGNSLVVPNRVHSFLNGRPGTLLPQSFDLSMYGSGSLIYVHLVRNGDGVLLTFNYQPQAETYNTIYVGQISNQNGTYAITDGFVPTIRIGLYRLSQTPRGNSFFATQGHPSVKTYMTFGGTGNATMPKAGVDTTQTIGSVTFDRVSNLINISGSGQFYVTNVQVAVKQLTNTVLVRRYSTSPTTTGYLNGQVIWQGYGDNYDAVDISSMLVEGWNTVVFTNGGCSLRCPFLN